MASARAQYFSRLRPLQIKARQLEDKAMLNTKLLLIAFPLPAVGLAATGIGDQSHLVLEVVCAIVASLLIFFAVLRATAQTTTKARPRIARVRQQRSHKRARSI
jgi:hypothetical protein